MGMGELLGKAVKSTGDAKRESGENITWRDVDYDELRSSRMSNPNVTSWDMRSRDDNANVRVNDSKGGVGGWVHPSTEEVRRSLRPVVETVKNVIDPYTGFSQAFMDSPLPSADTPLPSSQRSVSPISQARDSFQEDNVTEYMGRPLGDDDDQPKVGQIL